MEYIDQAPPFPEKPLPGHEVHRGRYGIPWGIRGITPPMTGWQIFLTWFVLLAICYAVWPKKK